MTKKKTSEFRIVAEGEITGLRFVNCDESHAVPFVTFSRENDGSMETKQTQVKVNKNEQK